MSEKYKALRPLAAVALVTFLVVRYWDTAMGWLGLGLSAAGPLLVGCAIAYVLNLPLSFYEKKLLGKMQKGRRAVAIVLSVLTLLLIVLAILRMVVPELRGAITLLIEGVPALYRQAEELVGHFPEVQALLPAQFGEGFAAPQLMEKVTAWLGSGAGANLLGFVGTVFSGVLQGFMAFIFALYILADKEHLAAQFKRLFHHYLKPAVVEKGAHVLSVVNSCFHSFLVGQCTEAVILGTLCALGMVILRFPYAVMTGVVVGASALIPVLGAYIGGVVGFIMIATESPLQAAFFLVYLVVLQQLENQLIYPKVVGASIGLPGIWVFAAVMVGSGLFGVAGILVGIPLTAAAYRLLRENLNAPPQNA